MECVADASSGQKVNNDLETYKKKVVALIGEITSNLEKLTDKDMVVAVQAVQTDIPEFASMVGVVNRLQEAKAAGESHNSGSNTAGTSSRERALSSEAHLRLLATVARISDAVFILENDGCINGCNRSAEQLFGLTQDDCLGKKIDSTIELVDEKTGDPFFQLSKNGFDLEQLIDRRYVLPNSMGEEAVRVVTSFGLYLYDDTGSKNGVVFFFREMTNQERLEEELFRIRKLESVGLLAGGIAHDFNNILTGIITNLFMARMSASGNVEACSLIADAEQAAFKATRLTKQLLTFSQSAALVKENVSIQQLIEEMVGFSLSGSNVDYRLDFGVDLWSVGADKGQIDQVLNNLIVNAAQAMPDGGTVTISVENHVHSVQSGIEDRTAGSNVALHSGKYVKITIYDEGVGIPRKHFDKIFDPYFTTKKGNTGLGLTIAYSIVKKHGGYIGVDSQRGRGTSMNIYLPAIDETGKENSSSAPEQVSATGRVLVMDDDVIVRTVVEKLLKKSGYEVECVTNGADALEVYRRAQAAQQPFKFVIMDLTIPGGMGGKETVVKLKAFDENAKVIVFSGYSNDPILIHFKEYGFDGVLKKPFSTSELMQMIQTVVLKNQ